jgi:bifunctional DNase/RNase
MTLTIARRIYLPLLLVAASACACAHHGPTTSANGTEVRVEVTNVGLDRDTGAHFVLLQDHELDRGLPILIGANEAETIILEMHGLKPPRPLTQDLMRSIIEQTGNHVDRVVISEMRDEVYFAKIVLDGGRHDVDSRPSDAIALAMSTHAPIYVSEKLLEPTSSFEVDAPARFPRSQRALGITVQELTPTLASYFEVTPKSAVLIADVSREAKRAGLQHGDLITSIDGNSIGGLADFDRQVAALKDSKPVTLTIKRDGAQKSITIRPGKN